MKHHKRYREKQKWRKANPDKIKESAKRARIRYTQIMHGLKTNGCAICGYNKCVAALDFHHANPEDKKFGLHVSELSRKDEDIVNELQKCVLLCNRCHKEIHVKEKEAIKNEKLLEK